MSDEEKTAPKPKPIRFTLRGLGLESNADAYILRAGKTAEGVTTAGLAKAIKDKLGEQEAGEILGAVAENLAAKYLHAADHWIAPTIAAGLDAVSQLAFDLGDDFLDRKTTKINDEIRSTVGEVVFSGLLARRERAQNGADRDLASIAKLDAMIETVRPVMEPNERMTLRTWRALNLAKPSEGAA